MNKRQFQKVCKKHGIIEFLHTRKLKLRGLKLKLFPTTLSIVTGWEVFNDPKAPEYKG